MKLETRYSVGDRVYHPHAESSGAEVPCPDCDGEKVWHVRLPIGEEFAIACPTCRRGYEGSRGVVTSSEAAAIVDALTIGSVQLNTARDEVRYMANETGVGTGRVYDEGDLYRSCDDASAQLPRLMAEQRQRAELRVDHSRTQAREGSPGYGLSYCRAELRRLRKDLDRAERNLKRETGGA